MFRKNPNAGQMSLTDPLLRMPDYVRKAINKSWAPAFYENIFKQIDKELFAVFFIDASSRPNAPVNIIAGLLFLKELNEQTDEEVIDAVYFHYRLQYAIGITDYEKEHICYKNLARKLA